MSSLLFSSHVFRQVVLNVIFKGTVEDSSTYPACLYYMTPFLTFNLAVGVIVRAIIHCLCDLFFLRMTFIFSQHVQLLLCKFFLKTGSAASRACKLAQPRVGTWYLLLWILVSRRSILAFLRIWGRVLGLLGRPVYSLTAFILLIVARGRFGFSLITLTVGHQKYYF